MPAVEVLEGPRAESSASFPGGLLWSAGTNGIIALLGLWTGILASRILGPIGRGELAIIQTWPSVFAMIAALGLSEALVYYAAKEPERAGTYLTSATLTALLFSPLFIGITYFLTPLLLIAHSPASISNAQLYVLFIPVSLLFGMPYHVLRARKIVSWNLIRVLPGVGWLAVLVAASTMHRDARWIAMAYLMMLAGLTLPALWLTLKAVEGPYAASPAAARRMLAYGMPCVMTGIPQLLNWRFDQLLVTGLLPTTSVGWYVAAVSWSGATYPLVHAVAAQILPRVAAPSCAAERIRRFTQGNRLGAVLSFGCATILIISAPWGLPALFGEAFRPAVASAMVLVAASGVGAWNIVIGEGLRGLGKPSAALWAEVSGLVASVVAFAVLLPRLQLVGAAFASLIGSVISAAMFVYQAQLLTAQPMSVLVLPSRADMLGGRRLLQRMSGVRLWRGSI